MAATYRVKVSSIEDYLRIVAGVFRLTKTEQKVLARFITRQRKLELAGLPVDGVFGQEGRRQVAEQLGMSLELIGHYIKTLSKKKALVRSGKILSASTVLLPPPPGPDGAPAELKFLLVYGR